MFLKEVFGLKKIERILENIREYYKNKGIECEIHYVCVDDETWKININERNKKIDEGKGGSDFYLDEGLLKKIRSKMGRAKQRRN